MTTRIGHIGEPGDAQLRDVFIANLRQRAVSRFAIALSRKRPVIAIAPGFQKLAVDFGKGWVLRPRIIRKLAARKRQCAQCYQCDMPNSHDSLPDLTLSLRISVVIGLERIPKETFVKYFSEGVNLSPD